MKRKKWSEQEEVTLLTKYSELVGSGALAKLKTREKKFKPVAEHVNLMHNVDDPLSFPFKWSWRDVSIKIQNMRHQYLGVKQKIRLPNNEFNWKDGENHWENFLKYKQVFGDVELDASKQVIKQNDNIDVFGDCGDLGFGIEEDQLLEEEEDEDEDEDEDEENDDDDDEEEEDDNDDDENDSNRCEEPRKSEGGEFQGEKETEMAQGKKLSKVGVRRRRLGLMSAQVLDLQSVVMKREEGKREREYKRDRGEAEREDRRKQVEFRRDKRRNEREDLLEDRELELQEREIMWTRREFKKRSKLQGEFDEEGQRRMRREERREEEELEWREMMVALQIQHEKQMMQMHAEACQNQMQILGVMARFVCQFFGSMNDDGLGGGLGTLPHQMLQNLQYQGRTRLGDNGKPDSNSPPQFL